MSIQAKGENIYIILYIIYICLISLTLLCLSVSVCRVIQNRILIFILGAILLLSIVLAIYFNLRSH